MCTGLKIPEKYMYLLRAKRQDGYRASNGKWTADFNGQKSSLFISQQYSNCAVLTNDKIFITYCEDCY